MPLQYDQIPTAAVPQQPAQVQPKVVRPPVGPAQKVKGILFFEIVFGEILLGVIVLVAIFGLLNYFNIISLGKSFPFLAGLPHQTTVEKEQIATPFQYNKLEGNAQVASYIASQLLSPFQPADIQAKDNLAIQTDNVFVKNWSAANTAFQMQFFFEKDTNTDSYYSLQIGGTLDKPIADKDTQAVSLLLAKFMTNAASPSALTCGNSATGSFCEAFSTTSTDKGGQAVTWNGTTFKIFSCLIPHNTVAHAADASCIIGN